MRLHTGMPRNGLLPTGGAGKVFAPGLEKRMNIQNGRVGQGIRSGSLTQDEAKAIGGENKEYQEMLKAFKSNDGKVGPKERAMLHKQMNEMSKMIFDMKHN